MILPYGGGGGVHRITSSLPFSATLIPPFEAHLSGAVVVGQLALLFLSFFRVSSHFGASMHVIGVDIFWNLHRGIPAEFSLMWE